MPLLAITCASSVSREEVYNGEALEYFWTDVLVFRTVELQCHYASLDSISDHYRVLTDVIP